LALQVSATALPARPRRLLRVPQPRIIAPEVHTRRAGAATSCATVLECACIADVRGLTGRALLSERGVPLFTILPPS
jgi:hypothetical protein